MNKIVRKNVQIHKNPRNQVTSAEKKSILTYDVDRVGADDGLGQLGVEGVADDNGLLGHLVDVEGDVGGGDGAALGRQYHLRRAVDLVIVDDPLDLGGRIRDVGRTGDGHLLLGLGSRWTRQLHVARCDCNAITIVFLFLLFFRINFGWQYF